MIDPAPILETALRSSELPVAHLQRLSSADFERPLG
jgi:hypothetical protein